MRFLIILVVFSIFAAIGFKSVRMGACFFLWHNIFQPFEWAYHGATSWAAYTAFLVLLASYVYGVGTGRVRIRMNVLIWGTLVLLLWMAICSVASPINAGRFDALIRISKYLLPVILISSGIGSIADVKTIAAVLTLSVGVWTMEYGVETMISGVNRFMSIPGGQMTDNNDYGAAVVAILPMAIFFFFTYRGSFRGVARLFSGTLSILCVSTVVFSDSRGAAVSLGAQAALYVLLVSKAKLRDALVLGTLMAVIAVFFLPESFYDRMSTIETEAEIEESSRNKRLALMKGAWDASFDHPLFGVGPGMWGEFAERYAGINQEPHSIWPKVSAETGLPGLVLYITLLLTVIKRLFRTRTRAQRRGDRNSALFATALVMVILSLLTAFSFLSNPYSEFLWSWLAIADAYTRIYRPPEKKSAAVEPATT